MQFRDFAEDLRAQRWANASSDASGEIDTFLHRKRISPRKLFLAQGKVFPRAVFNPPRVGLYIPSEARAVIETQGGLKTARGYTFV